MKELYFKSRKQWRRWLAENHAMETGVWLLFYKKNTGLPSMEYGDVVEEALCYGWIDSVIKKIDERKFARKVTPRNDNSKWSAANMKRADKLIEQGLMTRAGLQKIEAARKNGQYKPERPPKVSFTMPEELKKALVKNKKAGKFFNELAPSYRKHFIGWVTTAKRPETKSRRIRESIRLLEQGKKLGLK